MCPMKQLTLLLLLGVSVWAQARIAGTVADPSGAVIPNAKVTAKDAKTGQERHATTEEKGYYILTNLTPSIYKVTSEGNGLGPSTYDQIQVSVGQERTLNIVLQPATIAAEVTVSGGDLTTVDTSSASIGANVNSREVGTLPLNG